MIGSADVLAAGGVPPEAPPPSPRPGTTDMGAVTEGPASRVSIVTGAEIGPAGRHGIGRLLESLRGRGIRAEVVAPAAAVSGAQVVIVGCLQPGSLVSDLLADGGASVPPGPEALLVRRLCWRSQPVWLAAGADERGLMYALLDMADRVTWAREGSDPFSEVREASESPAVPERALSVYTMHRRAWEARFFDGAYWVSYLDMLARNRFNSFVVIFGYENGGYMAPPYPYFFGVDGFPDIRVVGFSGADQQRYLDALNRLVAQAHARGLRFTAAIWDHIYRGGVQGPKEHALEPTPGLVWGLRADNLNEYTKAALAAFLRVVPGLDGLQFRMHWESGLAREEMPAFWADVYDGQGFEVNEPLATKMEDQPHELMPFRLLRPGREYHTYEFERYWHFYQVFGRIGYAPATSPEVWRREFASRLGDGAGPLLEEALHKASWVLPYAQAYCFPYNRFPTTRGWVEKQRREDLPVYAEAGPSDTEQFLSFRDAARLLVERGESARIWPQQSSSWFAVRSQEILGLVDRAEQAGGDDPSLEFVSTATDLRILAFLARYHSHRALAGLSYALFELADSHAALDEAIGHETHAVEAWEALVAAAGDIYTDDLMMGRRAAGLCGHWRDELVELRKGLVELQSTRDRLCRNGGEADGPTVAALTRERLPGQGRVPPSIQHQPLVSARAGEPLTVSARVTDSSGVKWVRLRYRPATQFEEYRELPMGPTGEPNEYVVTVPAEEVPSEWDFMYFIEAMDAAGNGCTWPDFWKTAPYVVVKTGAS